MKLLFVSAEVAPFAKVGGLADVAGSLPKALVRRGHDVKVVLPLYGMIASDPRWTLRQVAAGVPVPINGKWTETAEIWETEIDDTTFLFVGHPRFFREATSSDRIYTPGIEQYLFFTSALLRLPEALGWHPDVVHANDWHTGFVPVVLREKASRSFADVGTVFTIHNLAYQGEFGVEILDALALPRSLFVPDRLETWGGVNFLKAGCVYSDFVNTVSPTYAREVQTAAYGQTLEGLMMHLHNAGRLSGILNGIDTQTFDPAKDPFLPAHFSQEELSGKAICRKALLDEVGLPNMAGAPLAGAVTRLSSQKGLHLLIEAAPRLFTLPVQLIVQGLGDPAIADGLRRLEREHPAHLRFLEKFDEDLAQRIYAGCDLFAMPSLFEPCGLGQMIALRYGTIPVVRSTGGLADTIRDGDNGFVFSEASPEALLEAFVRASTAFGDAEGWLKRVRAGMAENFTWERSAAEYERLYRRAQEARARGSVKMA